MPRKKNCLLRSFFLPSNNKEVMCTNGKCEGKILLDHSGNLERHLKIGHSDMYNAYIKKKRSLKLKKTEEHLHVACSRYNKEAGCLKLNETKDLKVSCAINKETAELAIVELFTKCGTPLSLVEERPFKILTKPLFDALDMKLNKHNLIEKLVQHSCNLKQEISKQLKGRMLSLKVDAVTRRHLSVFGINVQFFDNNCITIKTLAIKELKERLTSDYLKAMILELLSEYDIKLNQICTISIDNGANMVKTVKYLKKETNCDIETYEESSENNEYEIIDFTMDNITNVRCGVETLHLCVMDVIKAKDIKNKLENLRTVVKKLRTQTYLNILVTEGYSKPIIDCPTICNSTYLMLERLMELKDFINLMGRDNEDFQICDDSWCFVVEFLETFKIIYTASIKLQSRDAIYSDLCIQLMNVSLQLETLPKREMTSILKRAVHTRKSELFDNDLYIAAVFLDPRIKTTLSVEHVARAKNCLVSLYVRLSSIKGPSNPAPSPTLSASANNFEDPLEAYLQSFDTQINTDESYDRKIIERDFIFYEQLNRLGINENVIQFWSSQKSALSEIANVVLAIPCTQVSAERIFSALEYIFASQRNNTDSTNLEHILLVRANDDFAYNDDFACED